VCAYVESSRRRAGLRLLCVVNVPDGRCGEPCITRIVPSIEPGARAMGSLGKERFEHQEAANLIEVAGLRQLLGPGLFSGLRSYVARGEANE
jgi:hypothetical protein